MAFCSMWVKEPIFSGLNESRYLQGVYSQMEEIFVSPVAEPIDHTYRSCRSCLLVKFNYQLSEEGLLELENITDFEGPYKWTLSDGASYTTRDVTHQLKENGCLGVTLETTNECGERFFRTTSIGYCADSIWVKKEKPNLLSMSWVDSTEGFGLSDDKLYKTSDGGSNWEEVNLNTVAATIEFPSDLQMATNTRGVLSARIDGDRYILLTDDAWLSWDIVGTGLTAITWGQVDSDSTIVVGSPLGSPVYISRNAGQSFELLLPDTVYVQAVKLYNNGLIVATSLDNEWFPHMESIHVSHDYGETWKSQNFEIRRNTDFQRYAVLNFINDSVGFVGGTKSLLRTLDGGQSWTALQPFLTSYGINSISFIDELTGTISDIGSISRTIDGGNTWTPEYCGSSSRIEEVVVLDDRSILLTDEGYYEREPRPNLGCNLVSSEELSIDFDVYPNPFLDLFTIQLSKAETFTYKVYDMVGGQVFAGKGHERAAVDLSSCSTGVYLLHVSSASGREEVHKLIKF